MDHSGKLIEDRYRLIKPLGKGGMGAVYLAQHVVIGRKVAIKLLHSDLARKESIVRRFFREAQASAAIKHPGIVDVFDMGITAWGEPYLVMEHLRGESLSALLARVGRLTLSEAMGIIEPLLEALFVTHRKGIIHRDIKPSNVFITTPVEQRAAVKLIDFGISKIIRAKTHLTQTGTVIGTIDYMAPEQLRGETDITLAADLWSLTVMMYEMLTGALPFPGRDFNSRYLNVLTKPYLPPNQFVQDCPDEVASIFDRGLAKEVGERFEDAQSMMVALRALPGYSERVHAFGTMVHKTIARDIDFDDMDEDIVSSESDEAKWLMQQIVDGTSSEQKTELDQDDSIYGTKRGGATPTNGMDRRAKMGGYCSVDPKGMSTGQTDNWTGTGVNPPKRSARARRLLVGGGLFLAATAAIGVLAVRSLYDPADRGDLFTDSESKPLRAEEIHRADLVEPQAGAIGDGSPTAPVEMLERADKVTIFVRGTPLNGRIFFGGNIMPHPTFEVSRSETSSVLRVEADGYQPYSTALVPSESKEVLVELVRAGTATPTRAPVARIHPQRGHKTKESRPKKDNQPLESGTDNSWNEGYSKKQKKERRSADGQRDWFGDFR